MPKLTYGTPRMCRGHTTAIVYLDGQRIRLGRWGTDEPAERAITNGWVTGSTASRPAGSFAEVSWCGRPMTARSD